jgi:hemoglobin
MKLNSWTLSAAVIALLALGGGAAMADMQKSSLYDRLGGRPAITAVVDEFIGNVAADPRINARFARANIPLLKQHLVELISAGSGGNVQYTGKDMRTAHEGMNISDAEFGALVEDLVRALDRFKVAEKEKGDLLAILGPMKPQIVGH